MLYPLKSYDATLKRRHEHVTRGWRVRGIDELREQVGTSTEVEWVKAKNLVGRRNSLSEEVMLD